MSQFKITALLILTLLGLGAALAPEQAHSQVRSSVRGVKYYLYTADVWACKRPNGRWFRYGSYTVVRYPNGRWTSSSVRTINNVVNSLKRSGYTTWVGNIRYSRAVYYR